MHIKIDKIDVNIKGILPETVRASVNGLDKALIGEFVNQQKDKKVKQEKKNTKIDNIKINSIKTVPNISSYQLQKIIVKNIVQHIGNSISK